MLQPQRIQKEKLILREKKKAPRKPLSPYIFFSQEKRKEIKKSEEGSNLTAKQIMKMVSKRWQEIKDQKEQTEKYEYLSLRDREAYTELKRFWDGHNHQEQLKPPSKRRQASIVIGGGGSSPASLATTVPNGGNRNCATL
mgnify:CR=1 FL=1